MADSWNQLGAADLSQLSTNIDTIQSTLNAISTVLDGLANVMDLVAAFLPSSLSVMGAITQGIVAALEQVYEDLLHNQIGMALHLNLSSNPAFSQESWESNGTLPYISNGMEGWLSDLAASAENPADPASPLTDSNTQVGGVMIVKGITSANELQSLKRLYEAFTDYSDFQEVADINTTLEGLNKEEWRLGKLGPIVASPFARSRVRGDKSGKSPFWVNANVGRAVPAVGRFVDMLKQVASNLRPGLSGAEAFAKLAEAFSLRARILADAADEIASILDTLESLLDFLQGAEVITLEMAEGGFSNFVNRALVAENLPDYGSNGIVAGVVMMATADNPVLTILSLLEKLGLIGDQAGIEVDVLESNIEGSFSEVEFP